MAVRRLVAVCVALLGLAACSDDSDAGPKGPESSSSVSPTPTASPSGPSIPPEAQGADEASAKAFVRFYFETLNGAMSSGEVAGLSGLATPACVSCKAFTDNITRAYQDDGYMRSDGWQVLKVGRVKGRDGSVYLVNVRQGDEKLFNAEGEVTRSFEGGERSLSVYLTPARGSWRVKRLDVLR